jgi:hypothetical protein
LLEAVERHRSPKIYRGSRRRVRRIGFRDSWSWEIWLVVAWVAFLMLVVIPWMAKQNG